MQFSYDPVADAVNIVFKRGSVDKTVELADEVNLDLNKKGEPLYLEILDASKKIGKNVGEVVIKNPVLAK